MTMEEITQKLKDILVSEGKKTKDMDVANALGINANAFAQMKFRDSVPYKEIMEFLAKRKISINLFFFGQDITDDEKYKTLRLFDAKASLGGGAWNDDEDFEEVGISKKVLEKSNIGAISRLDMIGAMGDSMEPYICEGDMCFIALDFPYKDGEIYAINTPDGVVIKECYKQNDEYMLVSYNPIYTPVRYSIYECQIIGQFCGIIRGRGRLKIKMLD